MSVLHFFQAGGWVMWPLLALSLVAVSLIIERAGTYRTVAQVSADLISRVRELVEQGNYEAAEREAAQTRGALGACLHTILLHRERDVSFIERKVEEAGQGAFQELERNLPLLSVGATVAPLLGLLGTVAGMIGTFNAISAARTQGSADSILAGIGEALYATASGISVAVVCYLAYGYFSARLRYVSGAVEAASTGLINLLLEQGVPADAEAVGR